MNRYAASFLLLLLTLACRAQYPVTGIPVQRNGPNITNAWSGGLNAPQFSAADINTDGRKDLFVFDRAGDRVQVYLHDGGVTDEAYKNAPAYEKLFPPMRDWAFLRDYNSDGIPDIFTNQQGELDSNGTYIPPGIKVFKGARPNGNLQFELVNPCLLFIDGTDTANLWANSLGLPGIADVTHDGDMDVLTFNVFGSSVEYYENQTKELNLPDDSLIFRLITPCWGSFYVGSSTHNVLLGVSCKGTGAEPTGTGNRHTGTALSVFDYGADGDMDLLITTSHFRWLDLLNNSGNAASAAIGWSDTLFPSCNAAVSLPHFPNAFPLDADNDGAEDLLIAPNHGTSYVDVNNVQFYKNIVQDSCHYQYQQNDSFLVRTMLDFGTDSKGVFFDYNNDGLMDIVVGNHYYYNPTVPGLSRLALYENHGTTSVPAYRLVTDNFASLTTFGTGNQRLALNPAFGDLDGDTKADMVVGDNLGYIHFLKNTGSTSATFATITQPYWFDSIDAGSYAAPFIYDVNTDGRNDLIVGKQNGRLSYYPNLGTANTPVFHKDSVNIFWGRVNVKTPVETDGFSQPFITTDSAGNVLLLVGSNSGVVFQYLLTPAGLQADSFTMLSANYLGYDAGRKVTMQAADLNSDGKQEYLLGNSLGGLQLYSETVWDSSAVLSVNNLHTEEEIFIYPNPAQGQFVVALGTGVGEQLQAELINLLGERINIVPARTGNHILFTTGMLPAGVYVVKITAGARMFTGKVIIE